MRTKLQPKFLAATLSVLLAGVAGSLHAADTQPATDMGAAPAGQNGHVTLLLKLRDQAGLEDFIRQTTTRGSANYQHFLTTDEFAQRYGATDAQVAKVTKYLAQNGLKGTVLANRMAVTVDGPLDAMAKAFGTSVHSYQSKQTGVRFQRPVSPATVPAALADTVIVANGLSNERAYLSHRIKAVAPTGAPRTLATLSTMAKGKNPGNPTASGMPGSYTVGDVANLYNINPLYDRGIDGKGTTIAIVTLSNFDPADATAYWTSIGLKTKKNRIKQVHVDGGGAMDGGSGETALDVQQSGGLAPFANMLVYDAPNAGTGFTDAFMQAVVDNKADSISTSWGSPEIFDFAALNGGKPNDTTDVGSLQIFHQIFMEAAAQGQSIFAASGDSGAYDTVRGLGYGSGPDQFNAPLTVDAPANDPYITAAGGTTVPVKFTDKDGNVVLSVDKERAWAWDYLEALGYTAAQLFSVGGGGGVSVYWPTPDYQRYIQGVKTSEPGQKLVYNDPAGGPYTYLKLPGHFAGRNMPDISLNADPETGYILVNGGEVESEGGTSFVAPQLAGISALLTQSGGHRVGFLNPQVYALQGIFGYGKYSGFGDIRTGTIWYYPGRAGYDQATVIGTLDVANLDQYLRAGY